MARWTDRFVGDRMAVDREFGQQVAASEFSNQEWGTIMTAVDLEIENPETPEDARVVADTSKVDQVMPAIDEMRKSMPGGGAGSAGGGAGGFGGGGSGGGLFASIKRSLGLGGGGNDQRAESAAALADEYARRFQEHLEAQGKWEQACEAAAAAEEGSDSGFDADASGSEASADATGAEPDADGSVPESGANPSEPESDGDASGSE